jgi:hypothetical protein
MLWFTLSSSYFSKQNSSFIMNFFKYFKLPGHLAFSNAGLASSSNPPARIHPFISLKYIEPS